MRIDRIDKGQPIRPTMSINPGEGGLYTGRRKENLYTKNQKVPSKKYKTNYDKIKWGGDETEVEDFMGGSRNDGLKFKSK